MGREIRYQLFKISPTLYLTLPPYCYLPFFFFTSLLCTSILRQELHLWMALNLLGSQILLSFQKQLNILAFPITGYTSFAIPFNKMKY